MSKIVFINQSTGYLTIDTINAYTSKYENLVLITGTIGKSERRLNQIVEVEKIVAYDKSNAIKRIITWIIAFFQVFCLLLFKYRKYEVVYFTNPPISYLASFILRNPFSVVVYDAYPDALRNIGIKQGHWFYDMWSKWNYKLFNKAKRIYTLSEGMAHQLTAYVERSKIKVIPLWPASDSFSPIEKEKNIFVKKHHLKDKFVVMYSGNMGYTHNVDTLVEVADLLRDNSRIHFLFIGDGMKKPTLMEMVKKRKLDNCSFLDWQPFELLPNSLASADLGVVTLTEETALTSVPSKTFNLLAVGAPLLCIAPEESEIARIVTKFQNGLVCPATEQQKIAAFIVKLAGDKELHKQMSLSSLLAAKEFTKENAFLYLS